MLRVVERDRRRAPGPRSASDPAERGTARPSARPPLRDARCRPDRAAGRPDRRSRPRRALPPRRVSAAAPPAGSSRSTRALLHERVAVRPVLVEPLRLEVRGVRPADVRPFVPVEAEPAQAVDDPRDHLPRRSLGVGVLDAQHERAAMPPREQPVEERRARAADVQVAGRRRCEPDARAHLTIVVRGSGIGDRG